MNNSAMISMVERGSNPCTATKPKFPPNIFPFRYLRNKSNRGAMGSNPGVVPLRMILIVHGETFKNSA